MAKHMNLKVVDVVYETDDAVSLYFKQPLFSKIKYKSGQFLTLIIEVNGTDEYRAYSLNSADKVDKLLSVTIKRVKGGKVSNWVYENVKPGMTLRVLKPRGNFILEPRIATERHIILIGGGSGITPLLSIAKSALHFEPQCTVSLLYCNMHRGSVIFNKKLKEMTEEFKGRFNLQHVLEEADEEAMQGRLSPQNLQDFLQPFPKIHPRETYYYICGPEGMMDSAKGGLQRMGVFDDKIFMESFTGSTDLDDSATAESFVDRNIQLKMDGTTYDLEVKSNQSILDAALEKNIKIPFSCCSGACASCLGKTLSGEVKMIGGNALSDKEMSKGYMLSCVAHPVTDDVVIEIE